MKRIPEDELNTLEVPLWRMAIAFMGTIARSPYSPIMGALLAGLGVVLPFLADILGWLLLAAGTLIFTIGLIGKAYRLTGGR
ncbi:MULTISPECIES: hypothetical protein [unclassified Leptolyngbya]|uniref:hypothetical protein n=1 Tax=unclassified Leptolyngbya TaxID=2650499 RepID=UPI001689B8F4|nr:MULTISPECIES: hypothetical protein [unclassified Leptolyngbya]MBD1913621.1 hypothetical protein [Leptolyngbya sp. FACHB-8]MBD2154048.1 hypothetical protein [Leptolyngbya sp. FACHB-16]